MTLERIKGTVLLNAKSKLDDEKQGSKRMYYSFKNENEDANGKFGDVHKRGPDGKNRTAGERGISQ